MFIRLQREIWEMLHYHHAFEKFNHTMQFSMLRPFARSLTINNVEWKLKNSESVSFYIKTVLFASQHCVDEMR